MSDMKPNRIHYIDTIRGLAALFVLIHHAINMLTCNPAAMDVRFMTTVQDWFDFGKFGVVLFFIVSGFVVPFSLKGETSVGLRRFALSRFFRLYPAYWLSLAAALLIAASLHGAVPNLPTIFSNITMLQGFFGLPNVILVYWTLQIEIIFYGLCALMFYFGRLDRPISVFLCGCLTAAAALAMAWLRYETEKKLPVIVPLALTLMFFGLLFRRGFLQGERISRQLAGALAGLFILLMPAVALLAYNHDYGYNERWNIYVASYFAAFATFLLLTTKFKIHSSFFVWMGRISYSVYLFHTLVILLLRDRLAAWGLPWSLSLALIVVSTLAICQLIYVVVEAPAVALGHQLIQRLEQGFARRKAIAAIREAG